MGDHHARHRPNAVLDEDIAGLPEREGLQGITDGPRNPDPGTGKEIRPGKKVNEPFPV
jgi:hypothetical protein